MIKKSSPGGMLVGPTDKDGGKGINVQGPSGPIIMGGGETVITEEASKKHCETLSEINQDGGGVAIPCEIKDIANTTDSGLSINQVTSKRMNKGGAVFTHKHSKGWGEEIKIKLLVPTSKGWKVEQTTTKFKRKPKTKIAYFRAEEIDELFENESMAKGGYVRVPYDVKIAGNYIFSINGKEIDLKVAGFEREGEDTDSLYLMDSQDDLKKIYGSFIVKNNAMRKLSKGQNVTAYSSKTGEKGIIKRVGDLSMNKGGGVDLMDDYDKMPKEVQKIFDEEFTGDEPNAESTTRTLQKLEAIGYTYDYYLDYEPYNLRKIGQKGKYAKGGRTNKKNMTQAEYILNAQFLVLDELMGLEEIPDLGPGGLNDRTQGNIIQTIREFGITKAQFDKVASKYKGLDLVYSDYAERMKEIDAAKKKQEEKLVAETPSKDKRDMYVVEIRKHDDEGDYTEEDYTFYDRKEAFTFAKKKGNVHEIFYYPAGTTHDPKRIWATGGRMKVGGYLAKWVYPKNNKEYYISPYNNRWEMEVRKVGDLSWSKTPTIKRDSPEELKEWLAGYNIPTQWMEHLLGKKAKDYLKHLNKGGEVEGFDLDNVLNHFLVAGLWASIDDNEESMDANYSVEDVSEESKTKLRGQIAEFVKENAATIRSTGMSEEQLGHDLYLTSQGHGVGFWDRGYDEDYGDILSKSSKKHFVSDSPYIGDNGKVYFCCGGRMNKGGKIKASFYKWGEYENDEEIDLIDLPLTKLESYQLEGFNIRPSDLEKIFYAEENDIDEDEDGVGVKRAFAVEDNTMNKGGVLSFKKNKDGKYMWIAKDSNGNIIKDSIISFDTPQDAQRDFMRTKFDKGGPIPFSNSNLYIKGMGLDINGNSVIRVGFPNDRAFPIQTNGVLRETHTLVQRNRKISDFTPEQIEIISKEVTEYVQEYGSENQKQKLHIYKTMKKMYGGGEVEGTYGGSKTPSTIYYYDNRDGSKWYVAEGSVNVNKTYDEIEEGVDIEMLSDDDVFTASKPINSFDDLDAAINDEDYAKGGKLRADKQRKAKPSGWRFKGNNYGRPKVSQQGRKNTYFENRANRSDKNLTTKLVGGGQMEENFFNSSFLILNKTKNGLQIKLTPEGKNAIKHEGPITEQNFSEFFEDIQANSELDYFWNLGEVGLGMSDAPAITDGYYYDDNGELTPVDNTSEVYWFPNYMVESFTDTLSNDGEVFFTKADSMAKGGKLRADKQRRAKPSGWRFKGNNYGRPLVSQQGKRNTYFENRANRSDKNLTTKLAKGGSVELANEIKKDGVITEKQVNLLKTRMNNNRLDEAGKELVQWIWDNSPKLSPDQNQKGLKFLKNLWKSPTGAERKNNPFGYREQEALENFEYFELAGYHDASRYGQNAWYIPLYNVIGGDANFQYYYNNGEVSIVGAKGMSVSKKSVGVHTPKTTTKYLNELNRKSNIKFEDSSWHNDLTDSAYNENLDLGVYFPNAAKTNEDEEEFATFNLYINQSEAYGGKQRNYVFDSLQKLINKINSIYQKGDTKKARGGNLCPKGMGVQTLIFSKDQWTKEKAKDWAKQNTYVYGKVDTKVRSYRLRQDKPANFRKNSLRTITFGEGIKAVVGCPKKK